MKYTNIITVLLCAALLSGCASGSQMPSSTIATAEPVSTAPTQEDTQAKKDTAPFSSRDVDASYSEADSIPILLNGSSISCESSAVEICGSTATIRKEGTYLLSGTLEDGSIVVDTDKTEKVQLVLNGISIHSSTSAPIYVRQADKVFLTLAEGTQNHLSDGESYLPDGDVNIDAVIFSREDLTLNGGGSLSISGTLGHGICSKDSLRITGGSYVIEAQSHGLNGKDEVSIADGAFQITAGKDGIHAENTDDPESGNMYLENGTYQIHAAGDGISASGSCRIITGDYTIAAGGGSDNGQQHVSSPGFDRGQKNMDRGIGQMSGELHHSDPQDLGRPGMGGGRDFKKMDKLPAEPQPDTASETDTVSTKGIKAGSLTIDGGSFTIDCADDGLHSNGDLTVSGGTLGIASGDDGIHADGTVTILSGSVNITKSYEGIEGQHIHIQGGGITLTSSDDGLNAAGGVDGSGFGRKGDTFASSADTPSIQISGGNVCITASGDGIDANGMLEITGGKIIVEGPTTGDTSVLDYDISAVISGGTFLGTGASSMAQTFSGGNQGVFSINAGKNSAGTQITLADTDGEILLTHVPALDFEIVILSMPNLRSGESYTLTVGDTTQSFTAK